VTDGAGASRARLDAAGGRQRRGRAAPEPRRGASVPVLGPAGKLEVVWSQRSVIDYSLARRAVLIDLLRGRVRPDDACDAHPYLLRAARYHGEPTGQKCPVCEAAELAHVTYTYGDCFRDQANGRARATAELPALARELPEFTVYVVEVCCVCKWNHLATSYVLGHGERCSRPRRARSAGRDG
jgi:hypothetical protein